MSKCSWNLYRSGGRQTVNKYVEFLRFKETNKAGEEFRKGGPERLHLEGNRALKEVRAETLLLGLATGRSLVILTRLKEIGRAHV